MISKIEVKPDDKNFIRNSQMQLNHVNNFQNEIRQQLALRGIPQPIE